MQLISLFSGIGGFELAAEWMGWQNIVSCEINPFGRKVLEHYWPDAYHHDDIHTLTYEKIKHKIDPSTPVILTGGFPCQPYSAAGKRLGKEDERHLWPEMLRIIREVKPTWIVGENVLGLVNWNGGLVFHEVQTDLEAEGYEVQPYVLPAASVQNCPHRRDRVWFVAYRKSAGSGGLRNESSTERPRCSDELSGERSGVSRDEWSATDSNISTTRASGESAGVEGSRGNINVQQSEWGSKTELNHRPPSVPRNAADTDGIGLRKQSYRDRESRFISQKSKIRDWENFPTQSPICTGDDGFSSELDGITFSKWRNESIKAAGNAIVPQVVYQIFKAIQAYNESIH